MRDTIIHIQTLTELCNFEICKYFDITLFTMIPKRYLYNYKPPKINIFRMKSVLTQPPHWVTMTKPQYTLQ